MRARYWAGPIAAVLHYTALGRLGLGACDTLIDNLLHIAQERETLWELANRRRHLVQILGHRASISAVDEKFQTAVVVAEVLACPSPGGRLQRACGRATTRPRSLVILPRRGPRSRASEASLGSGVDLLGVGT